MARRQPQPKRDARLSFEEMEAAVCKIDRRLDELRSFDLSTIRESGDPRIRSLSVGIDQLLINIFGSETVQYEEYRGITGLYGGAIQVTYMPQSSEEIREDYKKGIEKAIAVLERIKQDFEEQLQDAGRTKGGRVIKAFEGLSLHPEIERAASQLYRDGHYAEAVEKAVKALNALVRLRSEEELDGSALMTKVFSAKAPLLRFNSLGDQSDRDEQQGFMMLFQGAVMALRNPRAHKIMEDDPEQALESIAFVSFLAKRLDTAKP